MPVTTIIRDTIAVIAVDNPPVNALSPGVPEAIVQAFDAAERDEAVSAIVFMGAGKTFVAGADINSLERAAWGDREAACDMHPLLARIEDCSKPVVMAIHGTALGGGLEIAMAGHFRIAVPDALIGQPEVNLGIIPGWGGTQRLARATTIGFAKELILTGRLAGAEEARERGLVNAVHDPVLERALEVANLVASKSPAAVAAAKELCNASLQGDLDASLRRESRELGARLASHEGKEGIAAFLEKREPRYR